MSIFKSTISPEIAAQLKARESIVSSPNRSDDFLRYTSGKNSWVRMTSFVNYNDPKGKYKGDELSKKYVLEGGTLYETSNNSFRLRSGVAKTAGIYASDLDSNNAAGKIDKNNQLGFDRPFGFRPMPGITNVSVMNKSAYGSLREATIQFYAWDKHQLEELEILFMRTGYTVFLEWGWSQYIDHDPAGAKGINSEPGNIKVKNFDTTTLNPFSNKLNEETVYEKIDDVVKNTKGNYDAMLGFIKNFSWQLMPNGGFQCSTTLISRGEAIDSIKASANPYTILGSNPDPNIASGIEQPQPVYSLFEKIFLNIIGHVNESEYLASYGTDSITRPGSMNVSGSSYAQINELQNQSETVYNLIKSELAATPFKGIDANGTILNNVRISDLDQHTFLKFVDGEGEGTAVEYISMNAFLAILNKFFILKDKNTTIAKDIHPPVVSILLPQGVPCLASEDSVSIDVSTCLIRNSKATLVCDNNSGFIPDVYNRSNFNNITTDHTSYSTAITFDEFIISGNNIGNIANIFIGINHIVKRYRELSGSPSGVDVITLLQTILDDISFALGGINDFKLYNSRNVVQIIDVKYFGNEKKDTKFKFDLIGLKSICRDVKINSRVFAEQATMMAIGATSAGYTNNLGDIYSSTQAHFNKGLTDRILTTEYNTANPTILTATAPDGTTVTGPQTFYISLYNQIVSISSYIQNNVLGERSISPNFHTTKLPSQADVINAGSLLKTLHYQINGKDVDFKALIPFELEITLDGIGGFIVGQIFRIDKSILPKDYDEKNLGFIITGISHSLQNNDWTTTVKTQICILENDSIKGFAVDKKKLRGALSNIKTSAFAEGLILCALSDFMVHQMFVYFLLDRVSSENKGNQDLLDIRDTEKVLSTLSYGSTYASIVKDPGWANLVGTSTTKPGSVYTDDVRSVHIYYNGSPIIVSDPYNYARRGFSTIVTVDKVLEYLQNWYNIQKNDPKNINDPFFPNDFNKFITAGGTYTFDAAKFKTLLEGGADYNKLFTAATQNDPAAMTDAWNKFWLGKLGPYNIETLFNSDSFSGGQKIVKVNNKPFIVQSVPTSADKPYLSAIDANQYNNTPGQICKIAVHPFEIETVVQPTATAGVSVPASYSYTYEILKPGTFLDSFGKFYSFLFTNRAVLGMPNINPPAGFTATQYNLEQVK